MLCEFAYSRPRHHVPLFLAISCARTMRLKDDLPIWRLDPCACSADNPFPEMALVRLLQYQAWTVISKH
ncbi:IKS protein kinase [Cryptococcus neoformans c45]|nr:IKS protein kinase [Cryptococcus neoformans var. grubii c45]